MRAKSRRSKREKIRVRRADREASFAERDWVRALVLWLLLESVCFGLAPYWGIIDPGERWQYWFFVSIPLGIIGAVLIGLSSQSVEYFNQKRTSNSKRTMIFLGQLVGGSGLAFILFPLIMLFTEFIAKATVEILQRGA